MHAHRSGRGEGRRGVSIQKTVSRYHAGLLEDVQRVGYVLRVQELLGVPVRWIGVGQSYGSD